MLIIILNCIFSGLVAKSLDIVNYGSCFNNQN